MGRFRSIISAPRHPIAGLAFVVALLVSVAALTHTPLRPFVSRLAGVTASETPQPTDYAGCHGDGIDTQRCNSATAQYRSRAAQAFPAGPAVLTRQQAIDDARSAGRPTASSTAVAHAILTTYGGAAARLGEGDGNPSLDRLTSVWLVTVDSPTQTGGAPDPTLHTSDAPGHTVPWYTVIIDANNGRIIDLCGGCNTVTSD
jgi:hypothetical protein